MMYEELYDVDDVLARQLMVARFDGAFLCKRCLPLCHRRCRPRRRREDLV